MPNKEDCTVCFSDRLTHFGRWHDHGTIASSCLDIARRSRPFATGGHLVCTNIIINTFAKVEKNNLIWIFYETPLQITLKHLDYVHSAINFNFPGKFVELPELFEFPLTFPKVVPWSEINKSQTSSVSCNVQSSLNKWRNI